MKTIKIEGVATISEKDFHFDSGMPSNEPVLEAAQTLHGKLDIHMNGSADFHDNNRIYLPPEMHSIASGEGYNVRRSSRHYIITMKLPIVESRADSERKINDTTPIILGEITMDRKEILNV